MQRLVICALVAALAVPSNAFAVKNDMRKVAPEGVKPSPEQHMLILDGEGRLRDRKKIKKQVDPADYAAYFEEIYFGIQGTPPVDGKKKILLFVHGGMNTLKGSRKRARNLSGHMMNDDIYPIFINWRSGPVHSYRQELFFVRRGHHTKRGVITSPLHLVADIGRGVARTPAALAEQLHTVAKSTPGIAPLADERNSEAIYCELNRRYWEGSEFRVSRGEDERRWQSKMGHGASYVATFLGKIVTTAFLGAMGPEAWENMVRSTRTVFHRPDEFDLGKRRTDPDEVSRQIDSPRTGGLHHFLVSFAEFLEDTEEDFEYEVTLVGHSMGTIILNEVIRSYDMPRVSTIVYMAAACSTNDFAQAVVPYLEANDDVEFYSTVLHPIAEVRETYWKFLDLIPRGSLLVMIDDLLGSPETPLDRTFGRWENAIQAVHVVPEGIRDRVAFKAFGVGKKDRVNFPEGYPQQHGQFDAFPFWREPFYEPKAAYDPDDPNNHNGLCPEG